MVLISEKGEINNKNNKKSKICENIRTKWTCFIHRRTGFIRQGTDFIRRADEGSPPVDEASWPTDEASPIGPYMFFLFFFVFSQMFSFCLQRKSYHQIRTTRFDQSSPVQPNPEKKKSGKSQKIIFWRYFISAGIFFCFPLSFANWGD